MLLDFFIKKLRYIKDAAVLSKEEPVGVPASLEENLELIRGRVGNGHDVKFHRFRFGPNASCEGAVIFVEGMADKNIIDSSVMSPVVGWRRHDDDMPAGLAMLEDIRSNALHAADTKLSASISEMIDEFLSGNTVMLAEGCAGGIVIGSKGFSKRSIAEPQSETVVRGPREGFTESISDNTSLIRRKIRDENLRVDHMTVGTRTKTDICIVYINGIARQAVVDEVKRRINRINVDSILESGYIEQYIEDHPLSPFSTVGNTEKPDVAASKLLEGRVVILVNGTPFVLTVPMLFIECFQTTEDYYSRPLYASMTRVFRYFGFVVSIFAPAVYIALTAFHQELIPTTLLFSIADAREGTPFPVLVETLIMVLAFEMLREAGIRLPRPVGQTISIVGALVMGDAAVSAGLVGAPVVITVAFTAVSTFLVPSQNDSASVLRIVMMVLASIIGWYGICMGFLAILVHLASLKSFGTNYFEDISWSENLQDSIIRMPLWMMKRRPRGTTGEDKVRTRELGVFTSPCADEDEEGSIW